MNDLYCYHILYYNHFQQETFEENLYDFLCKEEIELLCSYIDLHLYAKSEAQSKVEKILVQLCGPDGYTKTPCSDIERIGNKQFSREVLDDYDAELVEEKNTEDNQQMRYSVSVSDEKGKSFATTFFYQKQNDNKSTHITPYVSFAEDNSLTQNDKMNFLKGVFQATGSIALNKRAQFEFENQIGQMSFSNDISINLREIKALSITYRRQAKYTKKTESYTVNYYMDRKEEKNGILSYINLTLYSITTNKNSARSIPHQVTGDEMIRQIEQLIRGYIVENEAKYSAKIDEVYLTSRSGRKESLKKKFCKPEKEYEI